MRRPKGVNCHECAPTGWRGHTPNLSGDYDLDETMIHRSNKGMSAKLGMHLKSPRSVYENRHR